MQKAINLGLAAAVIVLGAGLAASIATRPEQGMTAAEVEALIAETIAGAPASTATQGNFDTAAMGAVIED